MLESGFLVQYGWKRRNGRDNIEEDSLKNVFWNEYEYVLILKLVLKQAGYNNIEVNAVMILPSVSIF